MADENMEVSNEQSAESTANKKKDAGPRDARNMSSGDVASLMDKALSLSKKMLNDLVKLNSGEGYSSAENSVLAFADEILFGNLYDFHEKNKWLKNIDYTDLDDYANKDAGLTSDDLMTAFELWRIINGKGGKYLNDIYMYLQDIVSSGLLRQVYTVIHTDIVVRSEHYSDILEMIEDACTDYDKILNRYKVASIFNEMPAVKKENGPELNKQLIVEHMLADFKQAGPIGYLIHDTLSYPDPYWFNYFTVVDSDTKRITRLPEISKFADEIQKIATLDNEVFGYFNNLTPTAYLAEILHEALDYLRSTYKEARDILNNYRYNTSEFPYSIMHYDSYVSKVANEVMSPKDPATNGTQYVDLAWSMLRRCELLAGNVAKQAP